MWNRILHPLVEPISSAVVIQQTKHGFLQHGVAYHLEIYIGSSLPASGTAHGSQTSACLLSRSRVEAPAHRPRQLCGLRLNCLERQLTSRGPPVKVAAPIHTPDPFLPIVSVSSKQANQGALAITPRRLPQLLKHAAGAGERYKSGQPTRIEAAPRLANSGLYGVRRKP